MDKIISEFRVVETDDGFRIEIKGDKERIRQFMPGFGWKQWRGRHGRRWRHRHGPFTFAFGGGPFEWMRGGPCWDFWGAETEEGEEPKKA